MPRRIAALLAFVVLALPISVFAQKASSAGEENSLVIVFKDGRQKSYSMSDIARIEVNTTKAPVVSLKGQNHFLGKWRVGDGMGGRFYITLKEGGVAEKSMGSSHGTWTVVDNEARISWDDGWHDLIHKVGNRYEKVARGPGKSFSDEPDNVAKAELVDAQPL